VLRAVFLAPLHRDAAAGHVSAGSDWHHEYEAFIAASSTRRRASATPRPLRRARATPASGARAS